MFKSSEGVVMKTRGVECTEALFLARIKMAPRNYHRFFDFTVV